MKRRLGNFLPLLLAAALLAALFGMPASADSTVDSYPSVFHMKIEGTPVVGETLTVSYDLYDPDNKESGLDEKLEWQLQDAQYIGAQSGYTEKVLQTGGKSYTVGEEAVGKHIAVRVPVSTVTGKGRMRTIGVGPILAETPTAPQAVAVTIENAGTAAGVTVGEPVEGHYLYAGAAEEGNSIYSWALSDGERGTYTTIEGATEKTYVPKAEDVGKYLCFTVTPVDSDGTVGEAVESVTRPIVGSASYGAHVSGNGDCYLGMMVNGIVNGIENNNGGAIYTYAKDNDPDIVIDLGEERVLNGVRVAHSGGKDADGVRLFSSLTGQKTDFTPLHTAGYGGDAAAEELILLTDAGDASFSEPVQARFVQVSIQKTTNIAFQEIVLKEALPDALNASTTENVTVAQDATEEEVRVALADKLRVKAVYGTAAFDISLDKVDMELDTTSSGTQNMTVSYKGQTTTVSVTVDGSIELSGLEAVKDTLYTKDLTVYTGATEEEIKSVFDGVVSFTAEYSDDSQKTLGLDDVEISLDTATAGTKTCTVTYKTQTAQLEVVVEDKKQPPNIYGIAIEGAPVAGETLTLRYTLDDPDGILANLENQVSWYYVDKPYGVNYSSYSTQSVASQSLTYTIPSDGSMDGKYIQAAIQLPTPYSYGWDRVSTIAIGPILSEKTDTPQVSDVTISSLGLDGGYGIGANVGQTLRGEYNYVGTKEEGESTYQWYNSDDELTGFTAISGATEREYTVQESDRGKYLKFTVTPKDEDGTAGTETESISRPMAGNAAYLAMGRNEIFGVTTTGLVYPGSNAQTATNGISNETTGGAVMMYTGASGLPYGVSTVDLGKTKTLTGARLAMSGNRSDTVSFYTSLDGLYWYPAETTDGTEINISTVNVDLGANVTFTTPVQARYLQIRYMRTSNNRLRELQAFVAETEPALQSIAAEPKDAVELTVQQNADSASVQEYLMECVTVTATYEDGETVTILPEAATYTLDTSAAGTMDAEISFRGKTTSVSVTVEAPELTGITVAKAVDVAEINVWKDADAAALKSLLADKIVITATYSDGSTQTIANADAEYSADTATAGTADVTVTYGGKTATISITVNAVTLTSIAAAKAAGVEDITIPQGTDAAGIKAALADKIVITATYSDGSEKTLANDDAQYSCNTSTVGETTVTVTYVGQTAKISVTVVATLTEITVDKATGVTTIEVEQNTDAAGLKAALADKIVITAAYSDGSTQTIDNTDAEYSANTSTVGTASVTVTYEGKTAVIDVTVTEAAVVYDVDPSLFGIRITGSPVVGETLKFEYTLYDPMGKETNLESKVDWQLQFAPDFLRKDTTNAEQSLQKGTLTYTIPNDSSIIGNYIAVNVTLTGNAGNMRYRTVGVGPILSAAPETPKAVSVNIIPATDGAVAGSDSGQTLMVDYLYAGAQTEGESTYQWYIASSENGTYTAIEGATDRYYTPKNSERKQYLKAAVIPVDATGQAGAETLSYQAVRVGNVAYRAYTGSTYSPYAGCNLASVTNGVRSESGGGIFTYGNGAGVFTYLTVDLGAVRSLDSAAVYGSGRAGEDGVSLQISQTGEDGTFTPIHTASYDGDGEELILWNNATDIAFAETVTGRYVKVGFTRATNIRIYEVELFSAEDKEPIITLNGGEDIKLLRGETYEEPGYTATDSEDGDLTEQVVVEGAVDTNTVGVYKITYTVTDSKPQTVTVVRSVSVADGYQSDGDLAYGKTVAADGENAETLVDGNPYTSWQAGSTTSSIVIDLGSEELVSSAVLVEDGNAVQGYVIEVSTDGSTWTTAYTGTTIGAEQSIEVDPVSGRYVRLRFTSASSAPKIATFEIRLDDLGKVKAALAALTLSGNLSAVTEDLALPNTGLYDTVITWQSSNTSVVTNQGIVKRGSQDQSVTLTATASLGEISLDKTFPITVLKSTSSDGAGNGGSGGSSGGRTSSATVQIPGSATQVTLPEPTVLPSGQFTDVSDNHWAKAYIEELAEKGIVNGKADGIFDAEGAITRAEFLKMIVAVFDLEVENPTVDFTDVTEDDWYYNCVATAAALGVTVGMGDGSFGADALITRQDMAVMVARAAQAAEQTLGQSGSLEQFTDAEAVSEYAREALELLVGAGFISGDDTGALLPAENATRAQAAKILCLVSQQQAQ